MKYLKKCYVDFVIHHATSSEIRLKQKILTIKVIKVAI